MPSEIPTNTTIDEWQEIAQNGHLLTAAYSALCQCLQADQMIMATWLRPRLGNYGSLLVRHVQLLGRVIEGVANHHCTELRFWAVPAPERLYDPTPIPTDEELFG